MSVDSKMFVTCGKDKLVGVLDAVIKQLNIYTRKELDYYWENHTDAVNRMHFMFTEDYKSQAETFTNGVHLHAYNMDCLSIVFGCGDDYKRSLKVFPDCSEDYQDIVQGDKILFSIGHWGKNHSIMDQVAIALSPFGDVYYDHDDCDDEGFIKVGL
ncbi:hypothetical protein [Pseudoalteromonas phage J2-1]|uniref:Uncharacterized protein n=1 Tax=Pseudoalteromonas phage J2-1 TaxID=2023998 RepID=A0A223LHK9_9CAUD|nr:hypothetical protein HOR90_gp56 [Pseudoalteromonas phage J2-1]ASU03343.1 hypothetical protein [Pseudoalteromonas phage J2-1]